MGREIISTCHNFPIPFHRRHVFGLQTLNVPENDSYDSFYHILSTFLRSDDAPHSHDQLSQIGIFWVSLKKKGGSHEEPWFSAGCKATTLRLNLHEGPRPGSFWMRPAVPECNSHNPRKDVACLSWSFRNGGNWSGKADKIEEHG